MLRDATKQLEEDLMDQGHQSMCVTSTTVLGVGASCYDLAGLQAETPQSPSSLLDTELNEAQKDAQELRAHVQGSAMDMPSGSGETDQVVQREFKRPRVE